MPIVTRKTSSLIRHSLIDKICNMAGNLNVSAANPLDCREVERANGTPQIRVDPCGMDG
uniref:Uncharacterized protein n=1 Tax=Parascaris equorum TaxID=6256 RepID=A0A914RRN0_PAREQ